MSSEIQDVPIAPAGLQPTQPSPAANTYLNSANDLDENFYRIWQPTGMRISVKLPYISDDETPIFAVRVSPRIGMVKTRNTSMSGEDETIYGLGITDPVIYPSPGVGRAAFKSSDEPVVVTIYDSAGPLNRMAHMYRYYKGSIKYRFRCITNFVAQGYVLFGVVHGTTATKIQGNSIYGVQGIIRSIFETSTSVKSGCMNNYVPTDLSQFRHVEVNVPFISNTEYRDMQWLDVIRQEAIAGDLSAGYIVQQPESFIVAYARGALTSFSGSEANLIYEMEYAPGDDFELFCELPLTTAILPIDRNYDKYCGADPKSTTHYTFSYPRKEALPAKKNNEEQIVKKTNVRGVKSPVPMQRTFYSPNHAKLAFSLDTSSSSGSDVKSEVSNSARNVMH